jgi:hypothetical protein
MHLTFFKKTGLRNEQSNKYEKEVKTKLCNCGHLVPRISVQTTITIHQADVDEHHRRFNQPFKGRSGLPGAQLPFDGF